MTQDQKYTDLFAAIKLAALQISLAGDPGTTLRALDRQIDNSFFFDPTLAQRYLIKRDDIEKQRKILSAAANLIETIETVLGEDHPDVIMIRAARETQRPE